MLSLGYDLLLLGLFTLLLLRSPHPPSRLPLPLSASDRSGPRPLKPRPPHDCPACRAADPTAATPRPAPSPWCLRQSRRGRPTAIATQGFACPTPECAYYAITDAAVPALVGAGCPGTTEALQTFRCQACHATFTSRYDTPLYRLKTRSARVGQVLAALAAGLDVAAAARVCGDTEATLSTWLRRSGEHMQRLHARRLQGLPFAHLQLDEIRPRLRLSAYILSLWAAIDPVRKRIPVLRLGGRTQAAAHQVVRQLYQPLAPGCCPLFTSDGLNQYFYALTAHFGSWVAGAGECQLQWQVAAGLVYGQVQKIVRRRRLVMVKQVLRVGTVEALRTKLPERGLRGRLNTSFVERVNRSLRRGGAARARRTGSTAQTAEQ